jgi:hypothetical protein
MTKIQMKPKSKKTSRPDDLQDVRCSVQYVMDCCFDGRGGCEWFNRSTNNPEMFAHIERLYMWLGDTQTTEELLAQARKLREEG